MVPGSSAILAGFFLVYESGDPWELNNLRNKASFFIFFFQFFFCSQVLMFVNIILLFIVRYTRLLDVVKTSVLHGLGIFV